MHDGVIVNARIVYPDEVKKGNLYYENGRILPEAESFESFLRRHPSCTVLDAEGAYAVPGGIDPHVHFGGFGEIPIADDFLTGSAAALAGGTTTVIDFAEPAEGESVGECIRRRKNDASRSMTDYAFHFVLTKRFREQLQRLSYLYEEGIRDFKLFTVYEGEDLTADEIREIFFSFAGREERNSLTFLIHSEAEDLIRSEEKGLPEEDMFSLALSRPPVCEREAVRRICHAACEVLRTTGWDVLRQVCIAHVSAGSTAQETECQKENRMADSPENVSETLLWNRNEYTLEGPGDAARRAEPMMETCPHYLRLTEEKLKEPDGALYTMTPPLRSPSEQTKLREAVRNGRISILSTDHCPYRAGDKYGKTFRTVPCGVDGVETRMVWLFTEGVLKRNMSLQRFTELTGGNAAKFYHLYPRKGCLLPESDADITLIRPCGPYTWSQSLAHGGGDYTIYEGALLEAEITSVVRRGELVYDGKKVLASPGSGLFLRRS